MCTTVPTSPAFNPSPGTSLFSTTQSCSLIIIVPEGIVRGDAELPQITDAIHTFGFLFRSAQSGKEHARQDRNDRNNDQQFDKREGAMTQQLILIGSLGHGGSLGLTMCAVQKRLLGFAKSYLLICADK